MLQALRLQLQLHAYCLLCTDTALAYLRRTMSGEATARRLTGSTTDQRRCAPEVWDEGRAAVRQADWGSRTDSDAIKTAHPGLSCTHRSVLPKCLFAKD